jgi:hypothetical protein
VAVLHLRRVHRVYRSERGKDDRATFHQQKDGSLPKSWILLRNQSTVNIFSNRSLLHQNV